MTHLLVAKEGFVVGQTATRENALRSAILSKRQTYIVSSPTDLKNLPASTLRDLNDDYDAQSVRVLWAILNKKNFTPCGKVSVKAMLRHLFADETAALTHEELLVAIPGATWNMITTGMSLLKNKKYADGPIMRIDQIDGKYRRTK